MPLPWSKHKRADPAHVARLELELGMVDERSGLPVSLAQKRALDPQRAEGIQSRMNPHAAEPGRGDRPGVVRRTWDAISSSSTTPIVAMQAGATAAAAAGGAPASYTGAAFVGTTAATLTTAALNRWTTQRAMPTPPESRQSTMDDRRAALQRATGRPPSNDVQADKDLAARLDRLENQEARAKDLDPRLDRLQGQGPRSNGRGADPTAPRPRPQGLEEQPRRKGPAGPKDQGQPLVPSRLFAAVPPAA